MGLHVHLYLAIALLILSAVPFFAVILLNGGAEASIDVVAAALGVVALLHVALALTARSCSSDRLRFWDGMRLITAYMTFGIGPSAMLVATPCAVAGLMGSIGIAALGVTKPQQGWSTHQFRRMILFFYRHRMFQ